MAEKKKSKFKKILKNSPLNIKGAFEGYKRLSKNPTVKKALKNSPLNIKGAFKGYKKLGKKLLEIKK